MLTLPIKRKWFDMILSGEKKEEYRDIKPYYTRRFENELDFCQFFFGEDCLIIILRNGYSKNSPYIKVRCTLTKGYGKEKWGAETGKKYYVLKIVEIMEVGNDGD